MVYNLLKIKSKIKYYYIETSTPKLVVVIVDRGVEAITPHTGPGWWTPQSSMSQYSVQLKSYDRYENQGRNINEMHVGCFVF